MGGNRGKSKGAFSLRELMFLALLTALMFALQVAMAALPNMEVVSLLVILSTLHFRKKALFVIYVFALLEGLFYGFHLWWIMYLYVWTVLWAVTTVLRKQTSPFLWAVVAGGFGLCYGALCSIPYFFLGGWKVAFSWWIAGIPFDLIHCAANFVLVLILFRPMDRVMSRICTAL